MSQIPPGATPRSHDLESTLGRALAAKSGDYVPRTRHLEDGGKPRYANRLLLETSPYLLQHAHNPVDWWPWCEEAFQLASSLDRPLFLSVGYSTCHWCHVMETECFEDEEIARLLNELYVPVKVDREERPDVDAVYMSSVQAVSGHGGWPMSVWLDHEARPFHAGTYFPPHGDPDRPGFKELLLRIAEIWDEDRAYLRRQAEDLTRIVQGDLSMGARPARGLPGARPLHDAAAHFLRIFDREWGGFGGAPKFPGSEVLRFLMRYHRRTGAAEPLEAVERTLDAMSRGGIHDHLGGGFSRYSVDREWLVPHFEKMLYDNALLCTAYLEAYQLTGEESFAKVARSTIDFVATEMTGPEGGFFSAMDADSEGVEGRFYVWTPEEIDEVVGDERGRIVRAFFGVTEAGNFGGKNVLHAYRGAEDVAIELRLDKEKVEAALEEARPLLYEARRRRVPPETDDKIIASWNGLMIGALAKASRVLGLPGALQAAHGAADFVLGRMRDENGRLHRTWRRGRARHAGLLDDYAYLASGLLDLFEATGDPRWLDEAAALQSVVDRHFEDSKGGWYTTPDDHEDLLARPKEVYDNATPSADALTALTCLRLGVLTGEKTYRKKAERAVSSGGQLLRQAPAAAPTLLFALDWLLDEPFEIVHLRPESQEEATLGRLPSELVRVLAPNAVWVEMSKGAHQSEMEKRVPAARGRDLLDGQPTFHVCRNGSCRLPTKDAGEVARLLEERRPLP